MTNYGQVYEKKGNKCYGYDRVFTNRFRSHNKRRPDEYTDFAVEEDREICEEEK